MTAQIKNVRKEILSDNWYHLYRYFYDYKNPDGVWEQHHREVYDRGNGAAILLLNREKQTVILTRQFRMPTWVNNNQDGMLVEVCAGLLDGLDPEECIRKEAIEETGIHLEEVIEVMATYMSPGAVTEMLTLYIGFFEDHMRRSAGGGAGDETEYLEVVEVPFTDALEMITRGEIRDAKTVILLQYAALHQLM